MSDRRTVKRFIRANKSRLVYKCAGLYLYPDCIARVKTINDFAADPEIRPIDGVSATIENATGAAQGSTLADQWVVIDGPDFQWYVKVRAMSPFKARKFVGRVNTVARACH